MFISAVDFLSPVSFGGELRFAVLVTLVLLGVRVGAAAAQAVATITRLNAEKVRVGMTLLKVQTILGGPRADIVLAELLSQALRKNGHHATAHRCRNGAGGMCGKLKLRVSAPPEGLNFSCTACSALLRFSGHD